MMIAGTGIRTEVARRRREAPEKEAVEAAEAHTAGGESSGVEAGLDHRHPVLFKI
jgi:hypothetical protein